MRILHISSARHFGGGERHVVDLVRGLAARGHDVYVALRPTNDWQHRLSFLPAENIFHVSIRNSFGVLSAMRIAEFARERAVDIIHAHVARDYIPASIASAAAGAARFVLTRHVLFPLKPFNRYALKNLACAVAVSESVRDSLLPIFPNTRIEVIPNGLDIDNYQTADPQELRRRFRAEQEIPAEAPLVGTLGELRPLKGHEDFLLAAAEVSRAVPDCRFVVVGRDNSTGSGERRKLRRLANALEIGGRVLWLDWLDDTAAFFAAIDVFVSASRSESFGLAILEAMARGVPIAATATEGAATLLEPAQLAPIEQPTQLAEKILELLSDEELRNASAAKMRRRSAEKFSLTKMIDSTERVYRDVTGQNR